MFKGLQASFDLILQSNDVFRKQCFFLGSEKLTLIYFQMLFFGFTETFISSFTWNEEKLKTTFSSWIVKEWHFQKVFLCLQICSIKVYLLLNIVPGLAQTVHEKLVEFGETKSILNKWTTISKVRRWWSTFFDAISRKNGTSRKSLGFRKHEINVQLFSNMVFGLGRTLVRFVY